MSVYDNLSL